MYIFKNEQEYHDAFNDDHEDFDVVVDGDWIQDDDYQSRENIVKHNKTGLHYELILTRHGSPLVRLAL